MAATEKNEVRILIADYCYTQLLGKPSYKPLKNVLDELREQGITLCRVADDVSDKQKMMDYYRHDLFSAEHSVKASLQPIPVENALYIGSNPQFCEAARNLGVATLQFGNAKQIASKKSIELIKKFATSQQTRDEFKYAINRNTLEYKGA